MGGIMERYGLVLEGGGVRGAYTAGALAWLQDNDITFDYSVGISSGALYLCCYLMKEKDIAYRTAVFHANDPKNTGLAALRKEHHYVAYKYMFNRYLRDQEHLSLKPLKDNHVNMEVGVYDLKEGKTVWMNPDDMDDTLDLIQGCCALPVASAVVDYHGRRILDGGITKMIPIERAVEVGCTKCLVITTKPADYVRKPGSPIVNWLIKRMYKECPQAAKDYEVRHINYYKQIGMINDMVEQGTALHVRPSKNIHVSRFKGDVDKCQELYDLGYRDMEERRQDILQFLGRK